MRLSKNSWFRLGCLVVLLIGFGGRVYRLDHQSFWNDEGNSGSLSSRSVQLIIEGTASDVHPPLYYLSLRGWWPLGGQSDFSLRFLSVAAGLIQVAASIAIGRLWLSRSGALSVGLLVALSPALIYYSQEARMYALLGSIGTASMLVLLKGLKSEGRSAKSWGSHVTRHTLTFTLLTIAGLYTHYVYPAVIMAQGLIVLVWGLQAGSLQDVWRRGWPWLVAVGGAVLVYAPWIPIFLRTGSSTRQAGDAPFQTFVQQTGLWLLGGPGASLENGGPFIFFALFVLLIGMLAIIQQKFRGEALSAMIWLFLPILLMYGVGATDENYQKFLTVVIPAVWLLAMLGVEWATGHPLMPNRLADRLAVVGVLGWLSLVNLGPMLTNPANFRDDYRAIAALIEAENRENGAVILNAPNQWEVFTWYVGEDGGQALYPMPKNSWSDERRRLETEAVLAEHDFVYALFWGFEGFDPNRIVERTLDERAFKSTDVWYGNVRLVTYGVLGDFLPSDSNPPDFVLATAFEKPGTAEPSGMRLDEVELSDTTVRPGEVLGLAFFWTATQQIDTRYKVFIQLLDGDGALVAQRDAEPVGNLKPTDGWAVDERVTDQHGLLIPADLPPGDYQLVMGLYETLPPNRRLTHGADQQDFIDLGTVTVER